METKLSKATSGGKFRVKDFLSCTDQRRHLCALGLTQGVEFELTHREGGVYHILVRGCGLLLDSESADCIICEPLSFLS